MPLDKASALPARSPASASSVSSAKTPRSTFGGRSSSGRGRSTGASAIGVGGEAAVAGLRTFGAPWVCRVTCDPPDAVANEYGGAAGSVEAASWVGLFGELAEAS